ncbi:MAG: DUF4367 domain-containing protein [Peptococcaceae bacterium]|nr:DUF4367 domain-containing protein [Peptococcaceae bacterium]
MPDYREDQLDELLKETIESTLDGIEVPPVDKEWEKFDAKYGNVLFNDNEREHYLADLIVQKTPGLGEENPAIYVLKPQNATSEDRKKSVKPYSLRFLRNIAAACILIAIFTMMIAKPQKAAAMGEWILQFFKVKTGETTENIQRYQGSSGQQAGEYQEIKTVEANLEEAQKASPFRIGIPSYLPGNVTERKIYYEKAGDIFLVRIEYYEAGQKVILLNQKNIKGDNAFSKGNDTDDSLSKRIKIKGNEALLFEYKNNTLEIVWDNNRVLYQLRGELPAEELIKIAESIG